MMGWTERAMAADGIGLLSLTQYIVVLLCLTCRGVQSIAKIQSLTTLSLDVDLPDGALATLGAMQNLKHLHITASREIPKEEFDQLKVRLPNCNIDVQPVKKSDP